MLPEYAARASEAEDIAATIRQCERGHQINEALVRFAESPGNDHLEALFFLVNQPLARAIESRHRLGGDAADEAAGIVLSKLWSGALRYPGDRTWEDGQAFAWLVAQAKPFQRSETGEKGKHEINVTPDSANGDDYDMMGNSEGSSHAQLRYGLADIMKLPDAFHRLVLIRVQQGWSTEEIAGELGRGPSMTRDLLREARLSLGEILKGRPPLAHSRPRDPVLMQRVQVALEKEAEFRPALGGDDAIKITEAELMELLKGSTDQTKESARRFFVEGKRARGIARELGVTERAVNGAVFRVRTVVGQKFLPGQDYPTPDEIWIVDAHGQPVTRYRQTDRTIDPKNPIAVAGSVFWQAIKDRDLEFQQVAKMRFVEGLSNKYIAAVTGVTDQRASDIARATARLVAKVSGNEKIEKENLVVEGDVSMIHTSPVEIPAELYLKHLESKDDPSEENKFRVAQQITGLPVENFPRLVLIDRNRRPVGEAPFKEVNRSEKAIAVPVTELRVAMTHLSDSDAKMLDLHLRHRWSESTLAYHFKVSAGEVTNALERGLRQLKHQTKNERLTLPSIRIDTDSYRVRPTTTQVDGAEFKKRVHEEGIQSFADAMAMVQRWKRRQISDEQPTELVDENGRPVFGQNQQFGAPVPENPITLSLADFEAGLAQSRLTDRDFQIMRLRFVHGWGVAGIHYVFGHSLDDINRATLNGIKNLNNVLDRQIGTLNLKVVTTGSADARLNRWSVSLESLLAKVRSTRKYSQEEVRAAAGTLVGQPEATLAQFTFVGADGRPALSKVDTLFATAPETPRQVSERDLDAAVEASDQRLVLRLRFQHQWSRSLIGHFLGKTDAEVKALLYTGLHKLQKNHDPDVKLSNLVIR